MEIKQPLDAVQSTIDCKPCFLAKSGYLGGI